MSKCTLLNNHWMEQLSEQNQLPACDTVVSHYNNHYNEVPTLAEVVKHSLINARLAPAQLNYAQYPGHKHTIILLFDDYVLENFSER